MCERYERAKEIERWIKAEQESVKKDFERAKEELLAEYERSAKIRKIVARYLRSISLLEHLPEVKCDFEKWEVEHLDLAGEFMVSFGKNLLKYFAFNFAFDVILDALSPLLAEMGVELAAAAGSAAGSALLSGIPVFWIVSGGLLVKTLIDIDRKCEEVLLKAKEAKAEAEKELQRAKVKIEIMNKARRHLKKYNRMLETLYERFVDIYNTLLSDEKTFSERLLMSFYKVFLPEKYAEKQEEESERRAKLERKARRYLLFIGVLMRFNIEERLKVFLDRNENLLTEEMEKQLKKIEGGLYEDVF